MLKMAEGSSDPRSSETTTGDEDSVSGPTTRNRSKNCVVGSKIFKWGG